MRKQIKIDLEELLEKGIISSTTADAIQSFYQSKNKPAESRITAIFGVLGAALIGLGIILIVAHNWDDLSRSVKTILAFLPMLIGQGLVGFTLFKKSDRPAWREGSATFLFFAVGACIAMVSQIYGLEGELSSFLLTWLILTLPLIYVMRSSVVSLLFIGGITWYACLHSYNYSSRKQIPWFYWGLMAVATPYFYQLWKYNNKSNAFTFHLWFWTISLAIVIGTFGQSESTLLWLVYAGLFGLYFLMGSKPIFAERRLISNPLLIIGALGSIILFLTTSFADIIEEIFYQKFNLNNIISSPEIYLVILLLLVNIYLISKTVIAKEFGKIHPMKYVCIAFLITFLIGKFTGSPIFSNLFLLWTGIFYILRGEEKQHLGWLNFGLLILTVLILCRFFDIDMSFVTRGVLFILMGVGFLFANLRIIRKRKLKPE